MMTLQMCEVGVKEMERKTERWPLLFVFLGDIKITDSTAS